MNGKRSQIYSLPHDPIVSGDCQSEVAENMMAQFPDIFKDAIAPPSPYGAWLTSVLEENSSRVFEMEDACFAMIGNVKILTPFSVEPTK
jgi:hypothetical protein